VRALARRDHSIESLRAKLRRAGFTAPAQDAALDSLARAGYLDDARFAHARAAHLAGRGYGDDWIRADLEAQGVSAPEIDDALRALPPEPDRVVEQAVRLGGGIRAARALGRRGFSEDALERVLPSTVAEEP
jgi:regulatory protein